MKAKRNVPIFLGINSSTNGILIYFFTIIAASISLIARKPLLADIMVLPVFFLVILGFNRRKERIPKICVVLLLFQNMTLGVLAHLFEYSAADLAFLTQIPFIFLVVAFVITMLWRWQAGAGLFLKLEGWAFLALAVLLLMQVLVSSGGFSAKIVGLRNYTTFFLAYWIGKTCLSGKQELLKFFRFFVFACVIVVLVGLVMNGMSFSMWESIGLREVYIAKRDVIVGDKFPARFYTDFLGYNVHRMASLYYEPVNLAYFLGAGFLTAVGSPWTKSRLLKAIAAIIIGGGLFLTFGKGGILITGIALFGLYIFIQIRMIKRGEERRIKNILLVMLIPLIYFAGSYYVMHYNASTNPHFIGIVSTWESVLKQPWGYGLGNGGNASFMFDGMEGASYWDVYYTWLASGGETALMSFIYQMGLHSFVVFFLCFHGMATRVSKGKGMEPFRYMMMMLPYILLGVSIYQENTYTPQCIVPFMLMIGGMAGYDESQSELALDGDRNIVLIGAEE